MKAVADLPELFQGRAGYGRVWAAMMMANAAADYPERPVLYIVPSASGGGPDTLRELARYTGEELQRWQRVIRESGARTDRSL